MEDVRVTFRENKKYLTREDVLIQIID